MKLRTLIIAAGALIVSGGIAAAATVTGDLNLRSGPGTNYRVVGTMPAGAQVDILGCDGAWCRVSWGGMQGYASASYLGRGGARYYAPAPVYIAPPHVAFGWTGGPRWNSYHGGYGPGWRNHGWRGHRGGWHHGGGHRGGGHRHHR